jgi:dihydrofolate reductase
MRSVALQVIDYSLDGIIGQEDTPFFDFCRALPDDPDHLAWRRGELERAAVHVMGRNAYQGMSQYFPTAADHPFADIMNDAPKAVFSRTLRTADWPGTTIRSGDTLAELEALRGAGSGDILVHGGISFARSLIVLDAVDEYRITVFPYLAARGSRLFADLDKERELEFVSSTSFANGVVQLVYRRPR